LRIISSIKLIDRQGVAQGDTPKVVIKAPLEEEVSIDIGDQDQLTEGLHSLITKGVTLRQDVAVEISLQMNSEAQDLKVTLHMIGAALRLNREPPQMLCLQPLPPAAFQISDTEEGHALKDGALHSPIRFIIHRVKASILTDRCS